MKSTDHTHSFAWTFSRTKAAIGAGLMVMLLLGGCQPVGQASQARQEMLIYCGITMVKPMHEVIERFMAQHPNVNITLVQGGSQDLYNSLKMSKQGDLYLPGSASYRNNNLSEGLLGDNVLLGHNQAAIVVKKGNPKGFSGDLNELATTRHIVALCNPESGSIGRMTRKILAKAGILEKVMGNTAFLTTDSRNLTKAIKEGGADIVINWKATASWPENSEDVEAIALSDEAAPKKKLVLCALTFSRYPAMTKKFLAFAGSKTGLAIFQAYGF